MRTKLLLLLCYLPFISVAQEVLEIKGNVIDIGIFTEVQTSKLKNIEGSPYIKDTFVPAKINELKSTQFIRVNSLNHIVEVKSKNNKNIMLDLKYDYTIKLIDGSNKTYKSASFFDSGSKVKSFFEVVKETDAYTLYRQEQKKYYPAQKEGSYQDKLPARIVDKETKFFISDFKDDSENIIHLPYKKKDFFAFFSKDKLKVKTFMKEKNLTHKSNDDLIQIFDFLLNSTQ